MLRTTTYLCIAVCIMLFTGCDMSGSSSESTPETEHSGGVTEVQTNDEGEAKVETNISSQGNKYDLTINVKSIDRNGEVVPNAEVRYAQLNGKSFVMVGDLEGDRVPFTFFGTPEEMIERFSGSTEETSNVNSSKHGPRGKVAASAVVATVSLTATALSIGYAQVQIAKDLYRAEKFYITDRVESGEDYTAYCKTFSQISDLIEARYGASVAGASVAVNFLTAGAGALTGGTLEASSMIFDAGMIGTENLRDALVERAIESWGEQADALNDVKPVEVRVYFAEGDGAATDISNFYARFDIIENSSKCGVDGRGPTYAPGNGFEYFVTGSKYDPDVDDIPSQIEQEFGSDAKLADWNTLVDLYSDDKSGLVSFLDGVGVTEDDNAYLRRGGNQYWNGGDRHYFIKRHNGDVGGNFLVHDDLHSNTVSLGSWHNPNPALVRLPE